MNIEKSDLEILKDIITVYFNYFNGVVNKLNKLERVIIIPYNTFNGNTVFAQYDDSNTIIIYIYNILDFMEETDIRFSDNIFDTILIECIVHELFHADHHSNLITDSEKDIFIEECQVYQKTLSFLREYEKAIYEDLDIKINYDILEDITKEVFTSRVQTYVYTSYKQLYFNTLSNLKGSASNGEFIKELYIALDGYDDIKLELTINGDKRYFDIKSKAKFIDILELNKFLQDTIYKYRTDLDYIIKTNVYEDENEDAIIIINIKDLMFTPITKLTPVITKLKSVITKF